MCTKRILYMELIAAMIAISIACPPDVRDNFTYDECLTATVMLLTS